MFKFEDIANIFCISKRTIERKIQKISPLFKNFDKKKRKHNYTFEETQIVIKSIGIPPQNEFNRHLIRIYPNLF